MKMGMVGVLAVAVVFGAWTTVSAQESVKGQEPGSGQKHEHAHGNMNGQVAVVVFPVSCAAGVQSSFARGVALLHSFEYESANREFEEVAQADPKCAMAYWGQGMSLYHQLWDPPAKDTLAKGAELMKKARELNAGSEREKEYIGALSVFYADSDKLKHHERAEKYAQAMEGVYKKNQEDREAAAFYALSLLGSSPENDPEHTNAKAAVAILNTIFEEAPQHPGIAHYIIHSCDNPAMANLALPAARKYASLAPESAHAVHMPSHIFARLGLWQDDIHSNVTAIQVADEMEKQHFHVMHHKVHSIDFLEYAYLQIGDDVNAKAELAALDTVRKGHGDAEFSDYFEVQQASEEATFAIERKQWKEAAELQVHAGTVPYAQAETYWGRAVGAGHLRDGATAADALKHFDELVEATRKGAKPYVADQMKNERAEAAAWADFAAGKTDEALKGLRAVADEQDKVGKGETSLPAREMLGDMLMELQRPKEALAEYEVALRTDPNRFNGLFGAAEAAKLTEQKEKAAGYYAQLVKNCDGVKSDRVELGEAKTLSAEK